MNITFTARHFSASQRLQDFASDLVKKLNRFHDGIMDCDIILEPGADVENPQKAELIVNVTGHRLAASYASSSYEKALRKAVDNIREQLLKLKGKQAVH